MHLTFVNDANFNLLMLAYAAARGRPRSGGASFETDLFGLCPQTANTEWLTPFSETSDDWVGALAALELISNQARRLNARARACTAGDFVIAH